MIKQFTVLFFFLFIVSSLGYSQPIYQNIHEIKFGLTPGRTAPYTALIIRNSNGENLIRVQYFNSRTKKYTAYETPFFIKQAEFENAAGRTKPVILYGTDTLECLPVYFNYFSKGRFDESKKEAIVIKGKKPVKCIISSVNPIRREDIKQDYVHKFFLENEPFYMDLFDVSQSARKNVQSAPWFYYINIANTLDKKIGKGCQMDMDALGKLFRRIPMELDLPMKEINISGNKFTKQAVMAAVESLNPKKQDIVVFYYSGHGFSYQEDVNNKFPQLALKVDLTVEDEKIVKANTQNIEQIYNTIKAKGARLNLVISDCCNSFIPYFRNKPSGIASTREPAAGPNRIEMANLFLKPVGSILMAAAIKGQVALSDPELGSIYTFQLCNKLIATIWGNANNVTWEDIIALTNTATTNMSKGYDCSEKDKPPVACLQNPIFKIELQSR